MKKPIYITLAVVLSSIIFTVFYSFAAQNEERIILTTYYPAPYGVYREMRVDRLAVGSLYRYYSGPGFDDTTNGTLIVSGAIGVGTNNPDTNYGLDVYNKPIKITPNPSDSTGKYLQVGDFSSFGTLQDGGATVIGRNVIPSSVGNALQPVPTLILSPNPNPGWTSLILSDDGALTLSGATDASALMDSNPFLAANVRFKVDGSGNVGIGTISPTAKLQVSGPGSPEIIIEDTDGTGGRPRIKFKGNDINVFHSDDTMNYGGPEEIFGFYSIFSDIRSRDASILVHGKAPSGAPSWGKYLRLTHDGSKGAISTDYGNIILDPGGNWGSPKGNVGIGTTNPQAKLEVNGDVKVIQAFIPKITVQLFHRTGTGTSDLGEWAFCSLARNKWNADIFNPGWGECYVYKEATTPYSYYGKSSGWKLKLDEVTNELNVDCSAVCIKFE